MTKWTILIIGACIIIAVFAGTIFSNKATAVWHLIHMVTMPDDLFTPIVIDDFEFHKKGITKEYLLNPKYRDFYEVSIFSVNGIRSADLEGQEKRYGLEGKFKIELFRGSQKLSEDIVTTWKRGTFKDNDMNTYKAVTLYEFPIPLEGFSMNNTKIRISVVEPDNVLGAYAVCQGSCHLNVFI